MIDANFPLSRRRRTRSPTRVIRENWIRIEKEIFSFFSRKQELGQPLDLLLRSGPDQSSVLVVWRNSEHVRTFTHFHDSGWRGWSDCGSARLLRQLAVVSAGAGLAVWRVSVSGETHRRLFAGGHVVLVDRRKERGRSAWRSETIDENGYFVSISCLVLSSFVNITQSSSISTLPFTGFQHLPAAVFDLSNMMWPIC